MNATKNIPVIFQKKTAYDSTDTRFIKVKIWLMHLEGNLNGSYFSKESVENAIPSLANTPILAYIESNSDNEKDFSDHRMVIVKEDDEVKFKYIGQAIGVIPEDNNAQFEKRVCDDGVEREFLTCDGLVWTKFDDPVEIFERDGNKAQSMELHDDFEGKFKDGLFHFEKFSFFGACALGDGVLPAMQNATIESQFSYDGVFKDIQYKLEEYKKAVSFTLEKGGNEVDKNELLTKYSLTEEDLKTHEIELDKYSYEELETKFQAIVESDRGTQDEDKTKFSMAQSQIKSELRAAVRSEKVKDNWGDEWTRYAYLDHDDEKVVVQDMEDSYRLVGFSYSIENDKVSVDMASRKYCVKEFKFTDDTPAEEPVVFASEFSERKVEAEVKKVTQAYATEKEEALKSVQAELGELTTNYTALEKEHKELLEFKTKTLATERKNKEEELVTDFSESLGKEKVSEVITNMSTSPIADVKKELFALVGELQTTFSKKTKEVPNKFSLNTSTDAQEDPYGGLFDRHLEK